jgi:methanogenic corrinoid protein MtbC1
MANVFDAAIVNRGPRRVGVRTVEDDVCGGDINWAHGLQGIRRSTRRTADASGGLLTKVIEGEIIPRLLLAHRTSAAKSELVPEEPGQTGQAEPDLGSAESFAQLVLTAEPQEIVERVDHLLRRGVGLERMFLDLLAPVARKLGEFWDEDRCTFADVTLGLARLHQVLHEIGRRDPGSPSVSVKRRAYFVPSPGEQHTFGLSMLEEFFLHAGWETASNHSASATTILETAATQRLDVIGFSVGCKEFLDPLSDLIRRARIASRNPDVAIMVGGRLFSESPDSATKLGAATVVCDGVHAVRIAEQLVSQSPRSREIETTI